MSADTTEVLKGVIAATVMIEEGKEVSTGIG